MELGIEFIRLGVEESHGSFFFFLFYFSLPRGNGDVEIRAWENQQLARTSMVNRFEAQDVSEDRVCHRHLALFIL